MRAQPVTDQSHIAEARRSAVEAATAFGFDTTDAGRVAIVATELATNIVKHGGGGEMLISIYDDPTGAGVELIALDRGRGISNIAHALQDGVSSTGTAGHGLGAIRRQSRVMEIASWPGQGTAILARLENRQRPPSPDRPPWGFICVPITGETTSGDAVDVMDGERGRTLIVADGLGHGPEAASAAVEAVRLFRRHQGSSIPEILQYLHAGLRATRGAAVALARFDRAAGKVMYGGIGNISAAIVEGADMRRMVSHNGTAGHNARRIQVFDYPYNGGLVVMASDGIATGWSLAPYPGLAQAHPSLIAAILYRDFARRRDDASILVARGMS
jgi:anti-sigma regulatory factor (Ser/Thr protein kinase)